jgi:glycogen(starch) synthase
MKIVHLASEFPPLRIFGLGRYVHDLSRAQVRRGHEVHVLTNSLSGKQHDVDVHGIHVHRIHFPSPPKPPDGASQVAQFNLCLLERVLELERDLARADVFVAHDWLTILAADLTRKRLGGRLILTIHDTVIGKTFGKMTNEDKFVANVERWGCRMADAVVAVSNHVRKELEGVYEAPSEKLHVVPCAVAPEWFQAVDPKFLGDLRGILAGLQEKIVSYVGRLDPEKGVDRLIDAFASVARDHPAIRLVIAGKGLEQEALEGQASRSGVADRIRFLGYVTGAALEALYKVSDAVVCPSTYEPFGIVPLEGMINRVPVIASDTGGMAEIVEHGKSGLKVPPGDSTALAKAIGLVLSNSTEARRLADGGYERARRIYSWDRVAELLDPVYQGAPSPDSAAPEAPIARRPKLTAGIRVKNAERFAAECLGDLSIYVDEIVILDDGSTDKTESICKSFPKVTRYVKWPKNFFHEGIDRNVVLALAKDSNPDWILLPDIDEVFEEKFKDILPEMLARADVALYAFLFCHFWRSRTHYRVDGKWGRESREFPIPRLVRNQPGLCYPVDKPLGTAQIRGVSGKCVASDIRVKHYGHLYEDLSRSKLKLYSSLDPGADYSYMVDESGLELEEWEEESPVMAEALR